MPTSDESQFLRKDLFFGHCLHVLDHSEPGTQKVSSTFLAFAYGKPLQPFSLFKTIIFLVFFGHEKNILIYSVAPRFKALDFEVQGQA